MGSSRTWNITAQVNSGWGGSGFCGVIPLDYSVLYMQHWYLDVTGSAEVLQTRGLPAGDVPLNTDLKQTDIFCQPRGTTELDGGLKKEASPQSGRHLCWTSAFLEERQQRSGYGSAPCWPDDELQNEEEADKKI